MQYDVLASFFLKPICSLYQLQSQQLISNTYKRKRSHFSEAARRCWVSLELRIFWGIMTLLSVHLYRCDPTKPPVLSLGTLPECHYQFWLVFITFLSIKNLWISHGCGCKCDTMNSRTYWVLINFVRVTLVWCDLVSSRGGNFLFVPFHIQANSGANFTFHPKDSLGFFKTSGSQIVLCGSKGIRNTFKWDSWIHFCNGCFEVYLSLNLMNKVLLKVIA